VIRSLLLLALVGCSEPPKTAEERALLDVKSYITTNMSALHAAAQKLQAAAPAADADGWNAQADAAAVAQMKAAWKEARIAYEHIEGAIAVLFPDVDFSTDERYEGFIAIEPDTNQYDDVGVTGVHAIERILWANEIPNEVIAFESALPGYQAATFPENATEAQEFKTKLCGRLVSDVGTMRDQFEPLALDPAAAYRGVIGSINEQLEKINKAATGEEESRYAQYTLADMRANVEAGVVTYDAFRPWLLEKNGSELDGKIRAGFARIQAGYAALSGDSLPAVPAMWSSEEPATADLATPFGTLWQLLQTESNPDLDGSLVNVMTRSADLMGIAQLP
jgi:iron uptake system component EfeO